MASLRQLHVCCLWHKTLVCSLGNSPQWGSPENTLPTKQNVQPLHSFTHWDVTHHLNWIFTPFFQRNRNSCLKFQLGKSPQARDSRCCILPGKACKPWGAAAWGVTSKVALCGSCSKESLCLHDKDTASKCLCPTSLPLQKQLAWGFAAKGVSRA